jgi:hypothetical protein
MVRAVADVLLKMLAELHRDPACTAQLQFCRLRAGQRLAGRAGHDPFIPVVRFMHTITLFGLSYAALQGSIAPAIDLPPHSVLIATHSLVIPVLTPLAARPYDLTAGYLIPR